MDLAKSFLNSSSTSAETLTVPTLLFFGPEKLARLEERLRVQRFVPDLAIEIVSQNDTFARLTEKAVRYRQHGTQEVWILDLDSRLFDRR